ncbi:MAG: hypothetical protein FRX49_02818, partial [Trebouxia sp. A1-2]
MDAIPYVDSLIKEYLLFRGFTGTLRAFNRDLASDRGCGFQADQLCELVFRRLVPLDQASELMQVLDFLNSRVYSRLPGSCEEMIRKLEVSILRAYIVNAVQAGKLTVVQDFFSQYGELLLHRAESSDWLQWFALPYLKEPAQDPRFRVFFTKDWLTLVEASFRNFVAEAIQHLPPPALLRFDTDRLQRSALQKQVDSLQTENAGLRQQLAVRGSSESSQVPAAIAQQGKQHRSQDKRAAIPETAAKPAHSRALFQQQQPPQPQQHVRTLPGQTAAYTMPAGLPHEHSQSTDLDSIQQGPASETSQWVLADGTQKEPLSRLQDAPSDISAQDIPAEDSQQALSLSNADLQPTWSASFTSLDANLLAENSSGTLSQLGAAGDDTLSLDTEASSPRMVRQDPQRQAEMSQAQSDVSSVQPLAGPASIRHHQHEAAGEFVQPATPTQQNGSSQHLSQHVAINSRSTGGSERGPRAAQRQASSGATLNGTASAEQLASHEQGITCCSFSPSGQNLATASSDGVLRISAPTTLQGNASRAAVLNCGAPVSVVAWDQRADKVMLVGTKGRGVKAWHLDTKSMISHIQLDQAYPTVLDMACSPTDPSFVCAAASSETGGGRSGTLTAWNMRAFKKLRSFDVPDDTAVGSISFSPDGHTLAAGSSDGNLRIYDVHSNRGAPVAAWALHSKQDQAPAVRYFADGSAIVSLSQTGQLQQWDLRRLSSKKLGQPHWTVDLSSFCSPLPKAQRHTLAVAQSSKMIATSSIKTVLPIVTLDAASRVPSVQSIVACRQSDSAKFVSALHWNPTLPALCCGLNNGQ